MDEYITIPQPPAPKMWPAFDFYRKFTSAECIAIYNLAKTDMNAFYFITTLEKAIASGANIRADDPATIAGMDYLQTVPEDGGLPLTAERAAEIMA